jgi:hypothetical protein
VLAVEVSRVIPATLGKIDNEKVLFPVPPVAVIVSTAVEPLTTLSVVSVADCETPPLIV